MSDLILHTFNNVSIGQRKTDGYINATKLCASYQAQTGKTKLSADWLRTKRAKETVSYVSAVTGIPITDLVVTIQGGKPEEQGTWIHPDLATPFGTWLSVEFEFQVSRWLQEWQTNRLNNAFPNNVDGVIPKNPVIESIEVIDFIAEKVFGHNALKDSIKLTMIAAQHPEHLPAIEAAKREAVIELKSELLSPTELGERMSPPLSAIAMNRLLCEKGLQQKTGKKDCPYLASGRGLDHSKLVGDTAKKHGKTIQKLRWYETILELVA